MPYPIAHVSTSPTDHQPWSKTNRRKSMVEASSVVLHLQRPASLSGSDEAVSGSLQALARTFAASSQVEIANHRLDRGTARSDPPDLGRGLFRGRRDVRSPLS